MLEKDDKIGEYNLVKFLGRGQFGEVWLAEKQLQFSTRKVRHALKFLSNLGDDVNLKAAEDEVDTWIEAGGHPNVMSVIDMIVANDRIVIISEFAEGGSLNGWLKKYGGKAPTEEQAVEMMLGILRGIEHLHSRNVVHRDLKPDNILLQGNFPRITDFGISRIVSTGTMSTKPIGSPAYMSPESYNGSKSPQIDIWSAGVMLYEMLTGKYPYEHESIWGLVNLIQTAEPQPVPDFVSAEFRKVIESALQKDVERRYQTATEMRLALERANYALKVHADDKPIAANERAIFKSVEDQRRTERLYSEEKTEKPNPPSETKGEKTLKIPPVAPAAQTEPLPGKKLPPAPTKASFTQPSLTQPSPLTATDDKNIQETQDWREIEARRQNEIQKISQTVGERGAGESRGVSKMLVGIGGVVAALAIIGGFVWAFVGGGSGTGGTLANKSSANSTAQSGIADTAKKQAELKDMVLVTGGEFTMGRDDGKSEAEKPAHKVTVQPFYMDVYEVTVQKYADPDASAKGLPKVGVNWQQAADYCKRLGKRLPSEAEWEFAARGTQGFIYPWGNEWKDGNANVGGTAFTEVGKFKGASPFGLYDMVGNAWEWTADDFAAYPNGKLPEGFAGKTNLKTIRGGSFEATKDFATATYRIGWAATGAVNYDRTGFRCVQDVK